MLLNEIRHDTATLIIFTTYIKHNVTKVCAIHIKIKFTYTLTYDEIYIKIYQHHFESIM